MDITPFTYLLRRIAPLYLVGAVVAFVISFALMYFGGEKFVCISGLMPAMASTLFFKYAQRFAFFPVEDKTLSRISIIVWLVYMLSGLAGILLAYPLRVVPPEYSLPVIVSCVVSSGVVLSLLNRLSDYGRTPDSTLFLIYTQVLFISASCSINLNQLEPYLLLMNGGSLVICLLLLWEHLSPLTADRVATASYEYAPLPLPTLVTNLVLLAFMAAAAIAIVVAGSRQIFSEMTLVLLLLIAASRAWYVCWRRNRASGLAWNKAVLVTLAQLALAGWPFRHAMGVKTGTPIRCSHCRQWRMVWMQDCPHCTGEKPVACISRRRWLEALKHDPTFCIFGVIMGVSFLFIVFFFATATILRDPRYFYLHGTQQEPITSHTEASQ